MTISNVTTTKTSVTFNIRANEATPLGSAILTFTTGLGSDSEPILITEKLPDLITNPSPIVIAANGQPNTIQLIFAEPRPTLETYTISTLDLLTATPSVSSLTLAAGDTTAQFTLTGVALGTTPLNIVLDEKLYFFSFPVFVSDSFSGDSEIFSSAVGVFLADETQTIANPLLSQSVGVFLQPQDSSVGNPLLAPAVGVFLQSENESVGNPLLSQAAGVYAGPVVTSFAPGTLQADSQIDILMTGTDLDQITDFSFQSSDAITVNNFISTVDGTSLTVTLDVTQVAPSGDYQMIMTATSGGVSFIVSSQVILTIP